jgi:CBS domain-containing protein
MGILSEGDVVAALALGASVETAVAAHMTPAPATAGPGEDSISVANRMLNLGGRHLPVVDGGPVTGMVPASDLLTLIAWPDPPRHDRVTASA